MHAIAQVSTAAVNCTPPNKPTPGTVEVRHGTQRENLAVAGRTVAELKTVLREHWGVSYFCGIFLNGQIVGVASRWTCPRFSRQVITRNRQIRSAGAATVMVVEKMNSPASEHDQSLVVLRYGPTCWRLPAGNWTVGQAKRWARSVWGVGYFVDACLNDQVVSLDAVSQSGDTLVFVRPPGHKGAEDWSDEAKVLFARYPELRTIAEDVTSRRLDTRRSVELALVMAVSFFAGRCGQPEPSDMPLLRQVLKMLADLVERLATRREPSGPNDASGHRTAFRPTPEAVGQLPPASKDMTTTATARELGCSRSMIYKLCNRGELAYRRVGNRYWFPRASVEEYKQKTTTGAQPPATPSTGYQFKHL